MFDIRPLAAPETLPVTGGSFTLTHSMEVLHVNPRSTDAAIEVRKMKGVIDENGVFKDIGSHQVVTLDAQGFSDLLASTGGGKPAGDFRLSDIAPAILKRQAEIKAAEDAKQPKPLKP